MTVTESANPESVEEPIQLTKSQRKRLKIKQAKLAKRQLKDAKRKQKEEPPVSSKIVLPKIKSPESSLDTEEKRLAAAQNRLAETTQHVLQISPVPRPCPPGLLKDLCPMAINIRFPTKSGAGYAFLQFRNEQELLKAEDQLTGRFLMGKLLKISSCLSGSKRDGTQWRSPQQRTVDDFDWNSLFVSHLPRAATRFDLAQVFRKASSIKLSTYDDGSCKGTCILTYRSNADALQAFETRHGTFLRNSPIYVNFALKQKGKPKVPDVEVVEQPKASARKRPIPEDSLQEEEEEADASSEVTKAKVPRLDDSSSSTMGFSESVASKEFVIDRSGKKPMKTLKPKISAHIGTNRTLSVPHPKLLNKHQLQKKGGKGDKNTPTPLDILLKPPTSKSKQKNRSKKSLKKNKVGKRH
ncbi:unnamed protein product [Calicophoron daubneyi]|uniref:RRM domain-containing protein n=1 Tax=Calicophoron daubneyi TaxID=300641 RepID=A0AAV2TG16_CALDB